MLTPGSCSSWNGTESVGWATRWQQLTGEVRWTRLPPRAATHVIVLVARRLAAVTGIVVVAAAFALFGGYGMSGAGVRERGGGEREQACVRVRARVRGKRAHNSRFCRRSRAPPSRRRPSPWSPAHRVVGPVSAPPWRCATWPCRGRCLARARRASSSAWAFGRPCAPASAAAPPPSGACVARTPRNAA